MAYCIFSVEQEDDKILVTDCVGNPLASDYLNYLVSKGYSNIGFKFGEINGLKHILKKSEDIKTIPLSYCERIKNELEALARLNRKSNYDQLATELNLCKEELKFLQTEYAQLLNDFEEKCYTLDVIEGIITERNK